jgi:hypothetical protein
VLGLKLATLLALAAFEGERLPVGDVVGVTLEVELALRDTVNETLVEREAVREAVTVEVGVRSLEKLRDIVADLEALLEHVRLALLEPLTDDVTVREGVSDRLIETDELTDDATLRLALTDGETLDDIEREWLPLPVTDLE